LEIYDATDTTPLHHKQSSTALNRGCASMNVSGFVGIWENDQGGYSPVSSLVNPCPKC